jgi:nicotinamidase-related amidase
VSDRKPQPWDGIIPEETQALYRRAGFGARSPAGQRPALLIIDVQYHAVGETPRPLSEAVLEHPMSCGEAGWKAIAHIAPLLKAFRERGLPVFYPNVAPRNDRGGKFGRMPSFGGTAPRGYQIVEEVAPREDDFVIPKNYPSAFFATALASHLNGVRADTLFITGCTTSGCIRATAVDAYSLNYKVIVPHECVFDRSAVSHAVNLFDLASKYADVVTAQEARDAIRSGRAESMEG